MHRKWSMIAGVGGWVCALLAGGVIVYSANASDRVTAEAPDVLDLRVERADAWQPLDDQDPFADDATFEDDAADPGQIDDGTVDPDADPFGQGFDASMNDEQDGGWFDDNAGSFDNSGWYDDSGWYGDSGWYDDGTDGTTTPGAPTTTVPPTTTTVLPTTTTTTPPTTSTTVNVTNQTGWCDRGAVPRAAVGPVAVVRSGSCLVAEAVQPAAGQTLDDAVAAARARADVLSVGAVNRVRVDGADPLRAEQWALEALQANSFQASAATANIVVAVIDSGVQASHPDLTGVVQAGYDALAAGDGRTDANGHGTLLAGVISAASGNGVGIAGFGGRPKILPVRVIDSAGYGTSLDVAVGIDWAVAHGAHVIDLSLGTTTPDEHLRMAVQRATAAGVVVVASAGNGGALGNPVGFPASLPGVISVASIDRDLTRSSFSTVGSFVAVAAPGRDIVSTWKDGGYARASGTSFAAAYTSAAVAVLLGDGATPASMRTLLTTAATDLGAPGVDTATGAGLVNVVAARRLLPPVPSTVAGGSQTTTTTTRPPATTTTRPPATTTTKAATTTTLAATTTTRKP